MHHSKSLTVGKSDSVVSAKSHIIQFQRARALWWMNPVLRALMTTFGLLVHYIYIHHMQQLPAGIFTGGATWLSRRNGA